jgi:hypothetical protein
MSFFDGAFYLSFEAYGAMMLVYIAKKNCTRCFDLAKLLDAIVYGNYHGIPRAS